MGQRPLEPRDIGSAQPLFARPLNDEKAVGKLLLHQAVHYLCRAVWTAIVDDQNVEALIQREDGADDFLHVLFLVIGGYNDDRVAFVHNDMSFLCDAKV